MKIGQRFCRKPRDEEEEEEEEKPVYYETTQSE